jgi:prepilin-type processing-associated H-X9-DG protein
MPKSTAASSMSRIEAFEDVQVLAKEGSWPVDLAGGFSSAHVLLSNFLFCDGSVRSVKQTIEGAVYRHLGHRADGEMIGSDEY